MAFSSEAVGETDERHNFYICTDKQICRRQRCAVKGVWGFPTYGDDIVTITVNTSCTNANCPYIKEVGDCPGNIDNCEYRQQRNDAFINYTFDGI